MKNWSIRIGSEMCVCVCLSIQYAMQSILLMLLLLFSSSSSSSHLFNACILLLSSLTHLCSWTEREKNKKIIYDYDPLVVKLSAFFDFYNTFESSLIFAICSFYRHSLIFNASNFIGTNRSRACQAGRQASRRINGREQTSTQAGSNLVKNALIYSS